MCKWYGWENTSVCQISRWPILNWSNYIHCKSRVIKEVNHSPNLTTDNQFLLHIWPNQFIVEFCLPKLQGLSWVAVRNLSYKWWVTCLHFCFEYFIFLVKYWKDFQNVPHSIENCTKQAKNIMYVLAQKPLY